ncbi:PepSY domain-containing protein [Nocardioides aequoreus]|uniref:PepSY domain-containing protein n=1 Tax=Nocardioides aequoreus TaxID=397278 RepID=UPI0004C2CF5C|nr:PepSY domain-containing protein [Nocardioides aequoreus]
MNFRSKRVLVPAALTAVLVGGGAVWATTASADDVRGSERDRVVTAALEAVPDGEAAQVETSDDPGEAYEVEVFRADGTEVDLALDADLAVVSRHDDTDDDRDDWDDTRDDRDADDRVLSATERERAEQAALAAVDGGVVTVVEASDDRGVAYEVEVVERDGTEHDVDLDTTYDVVDQRVDR